MKFRPKILSSKKRRRIWTTTITCLSLSFVLALPPRATAQVPSRFQDSARSRSEIDNSVRDAVRARDLVGTRIYNIERLIKMYQKTRTTIGAAESEIQRDHRKIKAAYGLGIGAATMLGVWLAFGYYAVPYAAWDYTTAQVVATGLVVSRIPLESLARNGVFIHLDRQFDNFGFLLGTSTAAVAGLLASTSFEEAMEKEVKVLDPIILDGDNIEAKAINLTPAQLLANMDELIHRTFGGLHRMLRTQSEALLDQKGYHPGLTLGNARENVALQAQLVDKQLLLLEVERDLLIRLLPDLERATRSWRDFVTGLQTRSTSH